MRKNFGPQSWVSPEPVLIVAAYDEDGKPNAMNAAWGGLSGAAQISMCLSPGHKTVKNILETRAFTISIGDEDHVVECDYVGITSGNNVNNKLAKAGFTTKQAEFVNAPLINELAMALECRLVSYDEESHRMVGEIVNVTVDERALDAQGNIDPAKVKPIIYDAPNKGYLALGRRVGNAYSDGAKIK